MMGQDTNGPPVWLACYHHLGARYEDEFDSLEDAIEFLQRGEDRGELAAEAVIGPDGNIARRL